MFQALHNYAMTQVFSFSFFFKNVESDHHTMAQHVCFLEREAFRHYTMRLLYISNVIIIHVMSFVKAMVKQLFRGYGNGSANAYING